MKRNSVIKIALAGVLAALTFVVTIMLMIPLPIGYVNFGDIIIGLAGYLCGPIYGAIAGGLGSALADNAAGYTMYVPFTLVIKGIEGLLFGFIYVRYNGPKSTRAMLIVLAALLVPVGYFITEAYLIPVIFPKDAAQFGVVKALSSILSNTAQAVICVIFSLVIVNRFDKIKIKGLLYKD